MLEKPNFLEQLGKRLIILAAAIAVGAIIAGLTYNKNTDQAILAFFSQIVRNLL